MMDMLERMFEKQIAVLEPNEQVFLRKLKNNSFAIYNNILKPVLYAIFFFWIFARVESAYGIEKGFYIQGVVIIIFLRMIASRLA